MLPYVVWVEGELRKYLIAAEGTEEARDILMEKLNLPAEKRKDLRCTYGDEDEMRNRSITVGSGWGYRQISHWQAYQNAKSSGTSRVIADYIF